MAKQNFSVTIPENPQDLIGLAKRILKKHAADGANSVLNPLNMADMQGKTIFANTQDILSAKLNRDKEEAFEGRDLALGFAESQDSGSPDTVDFYVKSSRDILLGIYKGKEHKLGEWGYEVDSASGNVSVEIPINAKKLIALAALIIAKHVADGAGSALAGLNMADFAAKNNTADTQHELGTQLNRDKEEATQDRDKALGIAEGDKITKEGTVRFYAASCRDVLLGLNKGKEQKLGKWGFDVQLNTSSGEFSSIALTVEKTSTKNAIANFKFDSAMDFELKNTGTVALDAGLSPDASTAAPAPVALAVAETKTINAAALGDVSANKFLNVTNADKANAGNIEIKRMK